MGRIGFWLGSGLFSVCALGVCGCEKERPAPPSEPSSLAPKALHGVSLASRNGFDLALRGDGFELVWGAPHPPIQKARLPRKHVTVGIWSWNFDAGGHGSGEPRKLFELTKGRELGEIEALALPERLAVGWTERVDAGHEVRGWLGEGTREVMAPTTLGANDVSANVRGNLRLMVSRERPTVFFRGASGDCPRGVASKDERCSAVGFVSLEPEGPRARRGPLSVPSPCPGAIVGVSMSEKTWQYALCSWKDGKVDTTLFSVDFSPQYARAVELEPGCAPLGGVDAGRDIFLGFDCGGSRKLAVVRDTQVPEPTRDMGDARFECERGHLVFRAADFRHAFSLPQRNLEVLLPVAFRHPGVRAVWTGISLVLAYPMGDGLVLEAHACRGGKLEPSSL
ncbi:MAG: hypothetical protein KC766_10900 [Myxococcales bacterium]|nr:hypothetical protein [Myxococcales bacterium]